MERRRLTRTTPAFRLFCSDLDGTLLGNPESSRRFARAWSGLTEPPPPLLCYSTGRLLHEVLDLLPRSDLPEPDYLLTGVGTEIYDVRRNSVLKEFTAVFGDGWDLERIERVVSKFNGIERQPARYLGAYKSSWYLHHASPAELRELKRRLRESGLDVTLVYSSLRDLDVIPKQANKGNALRWLMKKLNIPARRVLVAGDSGNDSSMFSIPGVQGIVVENAQPDLYESVVDLPVFCATKVMADGVLEGLRHFGVIRSIPGSAVGSGETVARHPAIERVAEASRLEALTAEEQEVIRIGYVKALEALRKNITPLGFSACSMADNEVIGTDVNYRSVWARDGAITIVNSIDLEAPDIRAAQLRTLRTLFDRLSPTGQVPSNVRIDDGAADYSGVGGVCSIDAGLWAVIAFYNYVRVTGDLDLLSEYADRIERAMTWLSAHDGNNNGLLEIPEAGDWTDLFGRSYEVLYDEILWFRANVCYGRLLGLRKDSERATEYLRRSQRIRGQILSLFWPSTKISPGTVPGRSFADQQFSVGDARYLLSEITPFGFNWRCDVLGNIMAFLFNVLDADRARIAFRFMWGVGVNDPWPVANLYPVVQSGDPDWKPYYVVNLQNLPHHYHNGGIWPFIGGMWVRFVHRLGLHELACKELYKLALANRAGKLYEWEFNEWLHGRTGRPMGKSFQAWSAASYIRACLELELQGDTQEG